MSREPDWDSKSPNELAILTAISGRACATYLKRIEALLTVIAGMVGAIAARTFGWL